MIIYIIPNTNTPATIISVITENILFFLFCFFPTNPAIDRTTDKSINPRTIIRLISLSLGNKAPKHQTMINVVVKHNKLSNPNFDVFVFFSFSINSLFIIHEITKSLKGIHYFNYYFAYSY